MLADADTYGGSVAQLLGLLDESPGLAAAARAVSSGSLDLAALAQTAREVSPQLRVLTGIVRSDRWPELRPAALAEVWGRARFLAAMTVVDCGFGLEQDEELSYDTLAPRRNGATLATLEAADLVLAVGRADPVGVQRLIRGLPEVRDAAPKATVRVVLTRVRKGPVGRDPETQLAELFARHAGATELVLVPEDQSGLRHRPRERTSSGRGRSPVSRAAGPGSSGPRAGRAGPWGAPAAAGGAEAERLLGSRAWRLTCSGSSSRRRWGAGPMSTSPARAHL